MKHLLLLKLFFILSFISLVLNQLIKLGNKKFKERCRWRLIGSECQRGLECSFRYGICLKKDGEYCINDSDCDDGDCDNNRCD